MVISAVSAQRLSPLRVALAWGVHAFTASGAVWGFLALIAIFKHDWRTMIIWMIVAMFVDGFDGILARWADVKTYAKGIDGALLDNILDYLNYVVVPALFLVEAEALPYGTRLLGACSILLTSAYQFTQTDAKTDDHHFKGFPSYWNVMALYMLLMNLPSWVNFGFLMLFNVLVFVPIKYIYPSRNSYLRRLTLALTYLYGAVGVWGLLQYPNQPKWVVWISLVYVAYYLILSLVPKKKRMRIEIAVEADDALHRALRRLVPQLTSNNPPPSLDDLARLLEDPASTLLIGRDESGEILAALTLATYRVPTGIRAIIEDVIVDGSARGQGMGEALIRQAIDLAREKGAAGIALTSNATREAANRLYLRVGFKKRETNVYQIKL